MSALGKTLETTREVVGGQSELGFPNRFLAMIAWPDCAPSTLQYPVGCSSGLGYRFGSGRSADYIDRPSQIRLLCTIPD
jgi:hypothetical protein